MTLRNICTAVIGAAALWGVGGCASSPQTKGEQTAFINEADATLDSMRGESRDLDALLDRAYGYAVFPSIGKGGVIVGGAHGQGVVYENNTPIGFVELTQASIGAQLGGQTFSEIVVFQTPAALESLKGGRLSLGANMSAVILSKGAGGSIEFRKGVAVVVRPLGGMMVDLSVGGQNLDFKKQPQG